MPAQAPPTSPPKSPPRYSRGQVTAEGVFAELAIVKPILEAHQRSLAAKLVPPLAERAKNIISGLKTDIRSQQTLEQVSKEVAAETVRESFENLGKIQDSAQIPQVLADSLTASIVTHPNVNPDLDVVTDTKKPPASANEEKIYKMAEKETSKIAAENDANLQKAAVLKNLASLADLNKQNIAAQVVDEESANFISENNLPDPEGTSQTLKGRFAAYSLNYAHNLTQDTVPQISQGKIPTLAQYQQTKIQASDQAITTLEANIGTKEGQPDIDPFLHNSSQLLGLEPATVKLIREKGVGDASPKTFTFAQGAGSVANFGVGVATATNASVQNQSFLSILGQQNLEATISQKQKELQEIKKRNALSYGERKQRLELEKRLAILKAAQKFTQSQRVKATSLASTFLRAPGLARLNWANNALQTIDVSFNSYPGIFTPKIPAKLMFPFLPARFFGGQAAKLGSFAKSAEAAVKVGELAGSAAFAPAMALKSLRNTVKKVAVAVGAPLWGLAIYLLTLGKAAITGFVIGGAVGLTAGTAAGAFIGFQVALVCGPFAPACMLATVPTFALAGGFIGTAIGGIAGALIALGLASGSATMVSMGAGAAAGGTIGGVVGFNVGAGLAATGWTAAIGACIASVVCSPFAPFMIAVGPAVVWTGGFIGGMIGATVGTFVGAAAGYLIGNYVLPIFRGFFDGIAGAFGAAGTGIGGLFGAFTGLASSIWGGLASAGSFLGSAFSSIGSLFGLGGSTAVSLASVGVFSSIGSIGIIGTIVGITTAASFFNPDANKQFAGQNEFFTVTKSSNITSPLQNTDLPKTVTFTIQLEAKDKKLSNIQISDKINATGQNSNFSIDQSIIPPCATVGDLDPHSSWDCHFDFLIENHPPNQIFTDSLITNTVTISATPEGAGQITDSASTTITVGTPPTICNLLKIQGPWTATELSSISQVCTTLNRAPSVVSLLGNAGTITLVRVDDGSLGNHVCGVTNANTIRIACDMSDANFAKYVIIHESGHVIAYYDGSVYQAYLNSGAYDLEGLVPTYPFPPEEISWCDPRCESFPEMISDYVISKQYNFLPRSWAPPGRPPYPGGPWDNPGSGYTTFKNDWPKHYDFAKNNIFSQVEF